MYKYIYSNLGVLLLLALASGGGMVWIINYAIARQKNSKAADNELNNLFKDIQRISRSQYNIALRYLNSISNSNGNDTNSFLLSLSLPASISQPCSLLSNIKRLDVNDQSRKTDTRLFQVRDSVKYQYESLLEFIQYYQSEVKLNETKYYENIIELSKIHDELKKYVNNKNFNTSNGSEWYQGFFSIFGSWFKTGANKDIETTYNEIVLKIVSLNKSLHVVPFVFQTTVCSLNCVVSYNNLITLNNRFKTELIQYAFYYKLSYRITKLILSGSGNGAGIKQNKQTPSVSYPVQREPIDSQEITNDEESSLSPGFETVKKRDYLVYAWCTAIVISVLVIFYCLYPSFWRKLPKAQANINSSAPPVTPAAFIDTIISAVSDTTTDSLTNATDFKILFDSGTKYNSFVYGIDISKYQGRLVEDLKNLDTLHFLICKATEGNDDVDPDFVANWSFIKEKGLMRGAYHFFHSEDPPLEQAELFLRTIKELRKSDIPPIVDVEENSLKSVISPSQFDKALLIFLRFVQQKVQRTPVIYSNVYFANRYLVNDSLASYPLWLADYSNKAVPDIPKLWKKKGYVIWQRSSSYNIGSHKTDFDIFNGSGKDFVKFIKSY